MMSKFSYSQILLALAIVFLAFSLIKISSHIPEVLHVIDKTSPQVDTIVDEITLIREEVKLVRLLVAKQTPEILAQVENALPVIEQVVAESERYSSQLPSIIEQIEKLTQNVQQLEKSLPSILQRVDAVTATTNNTIAEVALWRPHSRDYLAEMALYRENIPQYLTRAEYIVSDAKSIGKEASSGIATGLFKGVISMPFDVISGLVGIVGLSSLSAKHLTATDVNLMKEKIIALLNDENQTKAVWQNVDSRNRGRIIKGELIRKNQKNCHYLTFKNYFGKEKETLKKLMCLDSEGLWKVM
ncbi:MAG: hypothetical protein L3K24_08510 [Gammaproteobacteria bacterium]|nr:hypothetical protein [Gammaproteobacteria bacterium]